MTHFSTAWSRPLAALTFCYLALAPGAGFAVTGASPNCIPEFVAGEGADRVTLPRELKVNAGVIEHAMGNEASARLVRGLSNIFTELPPARMALLGYVLRAAPSPALSAVVPYQINPFFAEYPHLIDRSVLDNYALLFREFMNSTLSPYDLGLLATLLKGQRRVVMRDSVSQNEIVDHEAASIHRLRTIVAHPDYMPVVDALLRDASVREIFRRDYVQILKLEEDEAALVAGPGMDRMAAHVRGGTVDLFEARMIYQVFQTITMEVEKFARGRDAHEFAFDELTLRREGYLALTRQFLGDRNLEFTHAALIDVLDYVYFATPLPIGANDIYATVLRTAKELVMPVKAAAARAIAIRARASQLTSIESIGHYVLNEVDLYPPSPEPRKRTRPDRAAGAPEVAANQNVRPRIPPERALAPFTAFGDGPPPAELQTNREYEFEFLRDALKTIQRVRIGPAALEFFQTHPAHRQRAFLNALHMGWSDEGSGIREVWGGPRGQRCYRLKAKGSFRGLMVLVGRTWQLVKIVNKDDFDRELRHLEPL